MKALVDYSRRFIGIPYYWGGEHPSQGFDCSGFAQEVLQFAGLDPVGDQSAQALYDYFVAAGVGSVADIGALVFYGKSTKEINHVSIMTSKFTVIEAAGGSSTMVGPHALQHAIKGRAFIKERPINRRKDIVAIVMPKYPEWLTKGDL